MFRFFIMYVAVLAGCVAVKHILIGALTDIPFSVEIYLVLIMMAVCAVGYVVGCSEDRDDE